MSEVRSRPLTADDLMSRDVKTLRADTPLRDAAVQLTHWGVRGGPVVDDTGRCVGVISVSDLARGAARHEPGARAPRTCSFQERCREPGGRETTLCRLADGDCPYQRFEEMPDRRLRLVCAEPHSVPTDWQIIEVESLRGDAVRDLMTTVLVTVGADAPVPELARVMLERGVHRLVVLDPQGHPVGIVSADDLLRTLAHPGPGPAGDAR